MDDLRFACDAMLGGLARWLRLAGYDASFDPDAPGRVLAGRARAEGRWLLTCDRELAAVAGPRALLLRERAAGRQIAELRARLPMAGDRGPVPHPLLVLQRACSRRSRREAVLDRVPPYVAAHAGRFMACRRCGRVYWPGTHVGRIVPTLEAWFLA